MDSLIRGLQFVEQQNPRECYYWSDPIDDERCKKVPFDFSSPYPFLVVNIGSGVSILAVHSENVYKRVTGTRYALVISVKNFNSFMIIIFKHLETIEN